MDSTSINPNSIYYVKTRFTYRFLRALKQVNNMSCTNRSSCSTSSSSSSSKLETQRRVLRIKFAANMSMAAAVGTKRAWSRAMLRKILHRRRRRVHATLMRRGRRSTVKNENNNGSPNINGTKQLRKIVPGGEDLDDMGTLLKETAHYIKCLTTQVQVMKDILHLYTS